MKILLFVGILIILLMFQVMTVKEGVDASPDEIEDDMEKFERSYNLATNKNPDTPLGRLKVGSKEEKKILSDLIAKYNEGSSKERVTPTSTLEDAKTKLTYRIDHHSGSWTE